MSQLFASGRIVDLIVLLIIAEALALSVYRSRTGRGPPIAALAPNLLAGLFLLIALRAALVDGWLGWVALCLTAAFAAHAADLRTRWKR